MPRFTPLQIGQSARILLWTIAWLILADAGINLMFGAQRAKETSLGRYFEYGRSIEGKIGRTVVADPLKDGLMLSAGWIDSESYKKLPDRPKPGSDLLVAVYGQSFSMHAADELAAIDGKITLRKIGGPAAPPNHSYAAYKTDADLRKADVVVFGVLSASVPDMGSFSGLLWHFENPAPFTFPRYHLVNGQLTEEPAVIRSEAQFRQAFTTRSPDWVRFKEQLRQRDRGYDRFTFDTSAADSSSIVRLARRGWVAHNDAYEEGVYDPAKGFNSQAEDVVVLQAMIADMDRRTKERGERFVVLLLHTQRQSNHLSLALEGALKKADIAYISTHTLFSANDPTNFLPDSHYVPAANRKLAMALRDWIRTAPTKNQQTSSTTLPSQPTSR